MTIFLIGVGVLLLGYLVLTLPGRRTLWRFIFVFLDRNNVRLAASWGVAVISLVVYLSFYGVAVTSTQPRMNEERQRYDNLFFRGEFKTDSEVGIATAGTGRWGASAHQALGWFVTFAFVWVVIYTPIAFRDECGAAFDAARRGISERRGGSQNLPDTSVPAGQAATTATSPVASGLGRPLTWRQYFSTEFLLAFGEQIVNMVLHR